MPATITCGFCGLIVPGETVEDINAVVDAGWCPSLTVDGESVELAHCSACAVAHTYLPDPGREPILIPGHEQFLREPIPAE